MEIIAIKINGTKVLLTALVVVLEQWLINHFLFLGQLLAGACFFLTILILVMLGKQILVKSNQPRFMEIGLGILTLFPLNFLGLLTGFSTQMPISGSVILFLNERFNLVIGVGISLTILVWTLLVIAVANYWQINFKLQFWLFVKNVIRYILFLVGSTLGLLIVAKLIGVLWVTKICAGLLITLLTLNQLSFLMNIWAGPNKLQISKDWVIDLVIFTSAFLVGANLTGEFTSINKQQIIAHRGVYKKAQLPNSISSLLQTSRKKFDLVEMDVRETKDHYFICQHDDELQGKTGSKRVEDLTLKQIQKNNKVELFNNYLSVANKKRQRLLVEIKPGGVHTQNAGSDFSHQFKNAMQKNNGMVHSMNLDYLQQIKKVDKYLPVGLVMTINTGNLNNQQVDFYSIQAFSLNPVFIQQARKAKRPVYVWTVRRPVQSMILKTLPLQGQITDIGENVRDIMQFNNFEDSMILIAAAWNYL